MAHFDNTPPEPRGARIDVSVILVSYNTAHLLERVLSALDRGRGRLSVQVIVVDNASRDDSRDILRDKFAWVEVIESNVNVGFGRANNLGAERATGRYVLLLNTDAFVESDTLEKTVAFMDTVPSCGVLGVRLVDEEGVLQPSCRYFPTPWNTFLQSSGLARYFPRARLVDDMSWDHSTIRECDWVPGCYYLIRRSVIEHVGLFDHRYFLYFEEVDHCRSVKDSGSKVIFYPYSTVVHIGGESAKSDSKISEAGRQNLTLKTESELLYFRKRYGVGGLFSAVALSFLSDWIAILKLCFRGDFKRCSRVIQHASVVIGALVQTRFATIPSK